MIDFIFISFWLYIVSIVLNMLNLGFASFPIKREDTIGNVLFRILVSVGFAVWAGFLLYVQGN